MNMQIKLSSPFLPYSFRLLDILCVCIAGWLSIYIKAAIDEPIIVSDWKNYIATVSLSAFIYVISWGNTYRFWRGLSFMSMIHGIWLRWTISSGLILLLNFLFKNSDDISRLWYLIWFFTGLTLLYAERTLVYQALYQIRRLGYNHRHVVVIGTGKAATQLIERVNNALWSGYEITQHIPHINTEELELLEKQNIDEIWLVLPLADEKLIKEALYGLRHSAASIRFVPDFFALQLINHQTVEIMGMPMFNLSATPLTGFNQTIKWLEDKILSAIILLIISPIMIFLSIGVKLSSPGPIFYRQERIGLNNQKFMMLKFRSMPIDTEKQGVKWGGSANKATNKFGQLIRKTSLDELPQFINVLKGDMSIVGPRPERPMFVDQFKEEIPEYMKKHLVKAGITGWAQINGWRGDTDLKERIQHDIYYIEHWSLALDLKIIFMTFYKGFINQNAY
jgi:putative colanic acid biosynthesis UDP-glucose lipid carrier transferase